MVSPFDAIICHCIPPGSCCGICIYPHHNPLPTAGEGEAASRSEGEGGSGNLGDARPINGFIHFAVACDAGFVFIDEHTHDTAAVAFNR